MRTESKIEAAAAAAAEKANGGKFSDPLFYKQEHQAFWREVIRAALDAADGPPKPKAGGVKSSGKAGATGSVSREELAEFSGHCVLIRSVYQFVIRIWRDSDEAERDLMMSVAPLFFEDIGKVLTEFLVTAACRITDPAIDGRGNENFTVELFLKSFEDDAETYKQLDQHRQRMDSLRAKILPARNKLGAHADREVIRKGDCELERMGRFLVRASGFCATLE